MTQARQLRPVAEQAALPTSPMVSVAVTAYNSSTTIAVTLRSILAQEVSFPVEVVVGDDASSDGTAEIVRGLQAEFPGVIRLEQRQVNLRIQRNYYQTFADCRGKYIAWLDADDVWTDPGKLQLQVDALEADPGIVICGHFVRWVNPEGELVRAKYPEMPAGRYGLADILQRNFLPSPSVVFRRGMEKLLPTWYFDAAPLTDWPLYALAAQQGDILLLDGSFADYRLTPNSNFWGQGEGFWYKLDAKFYSFILSSLPKPMRRLARKEQGLRFERLSYYLRGRGEFREAQKASWQAFLALGPRALKGLLAATLGRLGLRKPVDPTPAKLR